MSHKLHKGTAKNLTQLEGREEIKRVKQKKRKEKKRNGRWGMGGLMDYFGEWMDELKVVLNG